MISTKLAAQLRSFSYGSVKPRLADAVTTHPRLIGLHLKYIKKSDIVHDFGKMKLICARPEYIAFLKDSLNDFFASEPTMQGMDIGSPGYDFCWPFMYNMTRYPLSYFVLSSNKNEIIGMSLQHVVYRKIEEDPIPLVDFNLSDDPNHNLHLLVKVLGWAEQHQIKKLGVDRVVHHEISYTPSVLRRQGLSKTWYPIVMKLVCEEAWTKMGIKYSTAMVTAGSNQRNFEKMYYKFTERIPEEIYKDKDGKIWLPNGEETAYLCHLDMEEAVAKKFFG